MSKLHPLEIEYIKENYSIFGPKKVSEKIGASMSTIIKYAKDNGLELNKINGIGLEAPEFKYDLNFSNRFENLDEKLSYWIGFFWADGCVSRHSYLAIEIIEKDGIELKKDFLSIFQFRVSVRKRRNKKAQMTFSANDKKVGELLESLGKYPYSSESHKKVFDYIKDENLQKKFLIGLIDGDGNFYWNKKEKYGQFTLASNYNQDWSFLCEYLKEFNPHITKDIGKNGKSSVLRITGRENIVNFIKFLNYENSNMGLERKKCAAMEILKMYEETQPKELTKHVFQYSKDGIFIKEFISAEEAGKAVGVKKSAIGNCACGLSKTSGGFIWRYK